PPPPLPPPTPHPGQNDVVPPSASGAVQSPFYQDADVHRVPHVPANFMLRDCSPPSGPPRLDPAYEEDFPDVRSLPWLTSLHQYLAHQSDLCLTAGTHGAGGDASPLAGRLSPPRYLGDRMCRTLAASRDERERLEGWRCMDSDTTYRTPQGAADVGEDAAAGGRGADGGPFAGPPGGETAGGGGGGARGDLVADDDDDDDDGHDDGGTEESLVLTDADEELRDRAVRELDSVAYHAPVVAGLRDAYVGPGGHVYTGKYALVPSGSCRPESVRDASPGSAKTVRGRVFVISQPHDPRDPHSALLDSLPRLAAHHSALASSGGEGILVHHSGGPLAEQVLGVLDIPRERLVEGDVRAEVVYLPEPSARCGTPSPYQASLLRDILRRRLADASPDLHRPPASRGGVVLIVQGGPDPAADARIANAGRLQERLRSEFPDKTVVLLRSRAGAAPTPARDALALFHSAKVVVAPRGPQLAFLLAAAPGTAVLEVVPDATSPAGRQPSWANAAPPSPPSRPSAEPAPSAGPRIPAVPGKYADLARSLGLEYYATAGRYVEGYRDVPAAGQAAGSAGSGASSDEDAGVESGLYVDLDKVRAVVSEAAEEYWNKR
ncbi:MAG: hypothetical protein BJ554DRAFT_4981, partial [Olpidium bornovanus]